MAIEVTRASPDELESWDEYVERSPHGTIFHERDALSVVADHSGAELHPMVGYKGQEPVGICPLFELRKGPVTAVFSPPPNFGVPTLGPALLNFDKLSRRKFERRNREFVEGCVDWAEETIAPSFTHLRTPPGYQDLRPLTWRDFDVSPRYTYHVDLSGGRDETLSRLSNRLRNDIRNTDEAAYEIRRGTEEDLSFVVDRVRERHEAQGETYHVTAEYARDLYRALGDDRIEVFVGDVDGERTSGMIVPMSETTMYYWQGGGKPDVSFPINDLLHWAIIEAGISSGRTRYDLVGANTPRLCRYKAKFNPELAVYYTAEKGTRTMNTIADLYKKLR